MDSRDRLTKAFKHFPGIGPRQARRFVYFLLSRGPKFSTKLAELIDGLHEDVVRCEVTRQYFQKSEPNQSKSPIARNPERDWSRLLIVETDMDLEAIEDTGEYEGMYYVLDSYGSLTEDNLAESLNLKQLIDTVNEYYDDTLAEIIVATSVTPEGERVREAVVRFLQDNLPDTDVSISTLGRGLSTGTELEYIDDHTLRHALDGRS